MAKRAPTKTVKIDLTHARKQAKQARFFRKELAALDSITVNEDSPELLKEAAPDTHATIRAYLTRRLRACAEKPARSSVP